MVSDRTFKRIPRHWTRRIPWIGPVVFGRPRWSIALVIGIALHLVLHRLPGSIRLIAAWDVACLFFLTTSTVMAVIETPEQVRHRAQRLDEGAMTVLLLTLIGAGACLFMIIDGSKEVSAFAGGGKGLSAVLVGATLILTWLTTQTSFTLHYAHMFYADKRLDREQHAGGLDFPGKDLPDYFDFAYFSFVLGMTFQVSDVEITDRKVRRMALLHGVISFFFSTVILALAINMLAGLVQ